MRNGLSAGCRRSNARLRVMAGTKAMSPTRQAAPMVGLHLGVETTGYQNEGTDHPLKRVFSPKNLLRTFCVLHLTILLILL